MKFFKKIFLILLVITVILFSFKNNFIVNKVEKILISFSGYTENVLKEVYVSGRINESRANILKAINVTIGESLLTIDLENIRKNLNNLSWVKDSSVYLLPLGQLEIEIYEYIPFGKFTDLKNNTFLINKNGVKFLSINISEFEINNCAGSVFHGITIIVDCVNDKPDTFNLLTLRSFGESFYHHITDACLEFGYAGV